MTRIEFKGRCDRVGLYYFATGQVERKGKHLRVTLKKPKASMECERIETEKVSAWVRRPGWRVCIATGIAKLRRSPRGSIHPWSVYDLSNTQVSSFSAYTRTTVANNYIVVFTVTRTASVLYAAPRRPAVSAKTGRHVQRCGVVGAPPSGGKAQPSLTPGSVRGYMSTPLAGTSGDEIILDRDVADEESSALRHGDDHWYTRPTNSTRTLYVTARNATAQGF